jgi:branched-chain amino acid aminotransferase
MAAAINIAVEKITKSKIDTIDFSNLPIGKFQSDHMFEMDYINGEWTDLKIVPYHNLSFPPTMAVLHYAQSVFEGLKAYRTVDGEIKLFRPEQHAARINHSAARMCMPEVPEEIFLEALHQLIKIDKDWVPEDLSSSLYVRPFLFATDEALGVIPSQTYKFIIFTCPVGAYYAEPVKVKIETEFTRAAQGGTGNVKAAGNYSASLLPAKKALAEGYQQILWTDGKEHKYIEEAGTMNIMFQIGDTIVTPELTSSILGGITRKSVIALAKKWGVNIEERRISVDELIEAHEKGQLKDAFGTGTAVTIHHIISITQNGAEMTLPPVEERKFSNKAKEYLRSLKIGEAEDYMNWMVKL